MDQASLFSSTEVQTGNNEESISQQEWAALFDAAIAFKNLKRWEWMYDRDVFGIQNPETGEILSSYIPNKELLDILNNSIDSAIE